MSQENDVREGGPQDEPILSSISNASDQVTNDALGESSQLATSSNQKNTGTDSKVVKINVLPLYSEDNASLKQKFIPEEPLPPQREFATIRVACEEEYARVAERFKVVDCAVTQTKKGAAKCQQYLTDEWTSLPKAAASIVTRKTEVLGDQPEADLGDEPIVSNASDQVTNALGQSSQLVTSWNQEATGTESNVVSDPSLYSEDNAPIKQKIIPEEPLPPQREFATIRVPCEEKYARAVERFKVVDCAVTQTKEGAAEFQQYLTDERTDLPPATTSTVRGMTESSSDWSEDDSGEDEMMETTTENDRKRKIDDEGHVEQKRRCLVPHKPTPCGTFIMFLRASRPGPTPSTEHVKAALVNLGLFQESPENSIPTAHAFPTSPDLWCIRFTTRGDLTITIASLLKDLQYSQKMKVMNDNAFGNKVEEYVYISKDCYESTKSITAFFILMHRTLRALVEFVQQEQLVMKDGNRLSIKDVVLQFGEESPKAFKILNGNMKRRLKFVAKLNDFTWKTTNAENGVVIGSVGLATIRKMDELVAKLEGEETQSVLKTLFTKNVVEMLKNKKTQMGGTLFDCVQAGVRKKCSIGIYAPDAEAYSVFAPFFDNVVHDLHGFSSEQVHPPCNMIHVGAMVFPSVDPRGQFVKSTKISCRRSLNGFPFASRMTKEKYLELECKVKKMFEEYTGTPLEGVYHPLDGFDKKRYHEMIIDKNLFRRGADLHEANALRHWPTGRGVFVSTSGNFRVCVNEQDHLRMESSENGSDIGSAYNRLIEGVRRLENKLEFSRNDRLGFVTFSPTDLGSTIKATVSIRLPKLCKRNDFLQRCNELGLQVRGIHGKKWDGKSGALLLTNKSRLGMSEYDTVRVFHTAVKRLIELERKTD